MGDPRPTDARSASLAGRYRSLFVVGRGGMGSVEVAVERTADQGERIVALKRLLPESAQDPRRKEMFLREARLAAALDHPNVVHAYASGEIDGEPYIAMEYVEGEPLSRVLAAARREQHPIAPALVAYILAGVCEGLHAAHELRDEAGRHLQLVHRDVSPHNVMVAYGGQVKLLDFGVAKLDGATQATRTGEVKGKMAYMSPEQALGEKLDRRSDLFGVGAMLYECLTGSPLWGQGTDVDIMRKLALETPPRLEESLPGAPPELAKLYSRLVARAVDDRPPTAGEVAATLRAFAASALPPPDAGAVKVLVSRFFATEATERRKQLEEHRARAAPGRKKGRAWTAGIAISAVVVAAVLAKRLQSEAAPKATATPTSTSTPIATPVTTATPTPTSTATAAAAATATPTGTASAVLSAPSRSPVTAPPPGHPRPKPPNVDPTPF